MNNTTNLKRMLETVMLSVIAMILIILSNNPIFSFLIFISAVPMMVLTVRQGIYAGMSGSVLIGILLFMMGGPVLSSSGVVMFGFSAVAAGYMIRTKLSTTQTILVSSLVFAAGFSILVIGTIKLTGADPFASVDQVFSDVIKMTQDQAAVSKISQEDLTLQINEFKRVQDIVNSVKPAMVIMIGFMLAVTNYFVARPIIKASGIAVKEMTRFRDHKLPTSIVPGILLILVLTMITDQMGYVDQKIIFLNIQFIFIWIFCLQGISTLTFIANAKGGNTARRSVLFIFLGIALIPFHGIELIAALGLMDTVIDIRKLYENRKV